MKKNRLFGVLISLAILLTSCGTDESSQLPSETIDSVVQVTGISLDKEELSLNEYRYAQLTATILPSNATNKSVTWESSDISVALVNNGSVYGLSEGVSTITATTVDGGFKASCVVNITKEIIHVTGVTIYWGGDNIEEDQTTTLYADVSPWTATNQDVTWSSSNPSVATVNTEGVVTGIGVGTSTITVTTVDGGFQDSRVVTVVAKPISVTGVTLNKSSLTLEELDSYSLIASVIPSDATNKNVSWSSSNSLVASVSYNGVVYANNVGTATIKATTSDGGYQASCVVTVNERIINVTGVSLNKTALSIEEEQTFNLTATVTPWNATNKQVLWTSSNSNVATVSSSGVVTGINKGTTVITVKTVDGNYQASCNVTILEKTVFSYEIGESEVRVLQNNYGKKLFCFTPITNTGNVNIYMDSCQYNVNDKDGNLVQSISSYSSSCTPDIIKPGETIYCRADYSYSGSLTEDELEAVATIMIKNASSYDAKRLEVSNVSIKRDSINGIRITGKVTNNMKETASLVRFGFEIYDANNNYILGDSSMLLDEVAPNQEMTFDIGSLLDRYFNDLNVNECSIIVRAYDYQFIIFY